MIDITKASVYVCSYTKYKLKDYAGGWIELISCKDIRDFYRECKKLHPNEKLPCFIFFDWENIPDRFINERWILKSIFPLIQEVVPLTDVKKRAFHIWAKQYNYEFSLKITGNLIEYFLLHYEGKFKSKEAFARKYAEEYLGITSVSHPSFNFKSYAKNLFAWNFFLKDGFVFKK